MELFSIRIQRTFQLVSTCHPQLTYSRVFLRNFYYYSIGYVNYYSYICLLIDWYCKGTLI